jgi:hypothetical protein
MLHLNLLARMSLEAKSLEANDVKPLCLLMPIFCFVGRRVCIMYSGSGCHVTPPVNLDLFKLLPVLHFTILHPQVYLCFEKVTMQLYNGRWATTEIVKNYTNSQ